MTEMTAVATGGTRHRSGLRTALRDSAVLSGRSIRHIVRNPEQAMVVVFLPIMLLVLFRYLFGGAIQTGAGGYVNYLIAGIMVISVAFNATTTTVGVCTDMLEGIVERFRSMPMVSTAVLTAHVVAAVVRNLISMTVIVLVGLLIGFRPAASPVGWAAAVGLMVLFVAAISWLAVIFGLLADSPEGATGLSLIIVFVPYASSAFVPPGTMPTALRLIVENQPVTPVIDAVRGLLLDQPIGNAGWLAVAWWGGILLIAVPLAGFLFRRRTGR